MHRLNWDIKFNAAPVIAFEIGAEGPTGANKGALDRANFETIQKPRKVFLQTLAALRIQDGLQSVFELLCPAFANTLDDEGMSCPGLGSALPVDKIIRPQPESWQPR